MSYAQPQASFLPPTGRADAPQAGGLPAARATRPPASSRPVGTGRTAPGATQVSGNGMRAQQNGSRGYAGLARNGAAPRTAPRTALRRGTPQGQAPARAPQAQAPIAAPQAPVQQQAAVTVVPRPHPLSQPLQLPSKLKWGTVKQVVSGDTIVLMGQQTSLDPAPTMQITLSGCRAPAVARSSSGREDAFGWHAKEYLRKKLIGQHVQFGDEDKDEWEMSGRKMSRQYATVLLNNNGRHENISETVIRNGFASVTPIKRTELKELETKAAQDPEAARKLHLRERLRALEEQAKEANLGQWEMAGESDAEREVFIRSKVRSCRWPTEQEEMQELFNQINGKPVRALVDKVEDGSTCRLEILPTGGEEHILVKVFLAGVKSPRTPPNLEVLQMQWDRRRSPEGERPTKPADAPPFAYAAQNYVEVRLLNREVVVTARCVDSFKNIFVSIAPATAPDRDICQYLLQQGLSEIIPWSLRKLVQADQHKLRAAEVQAQQTKTGIWSTKEPPKQKTQDEARVIQVLSGDSVVLNMKGKEVRAQLASIRAPKLGNRYDGGEPQPWAYDAKEFLRCKLINQQVKVVVEYTRERKNENMIRKYGPAQTFVSLYVGDRKENIALSLVNLGYAETIRHGQQDPRADAYATMLERENSAQLQKIGRWGDASKQRYKPMQDLSVRFPRGDPSHESDRVRQVAECRKLFAEIEPKYDAVTGITSEGKRIDGCVEHVFSGSRLKIAVPDKKKVIILVLVGLQGERYNDDSPPHVKEAYNMVRNVLLQRNVKFSVEAVDRGGNFIGHIWLGNKQNLGEELLRRGLAKVRIESVERSFCKDSLLKAEAEAKEQKANVWANYDPALDKAAEASIESRAPQQQDLSGTTVQGFSTHIVDSSTFYFQLSGDKTVAEVDKLLKTVELDKTLPRLRKGMMVAGMHEGSPYRCKYNGKAGDRARVYFIDYGNEDMIPTSDIHPLPKGLFSLPATAYKCRLAGLKAPPRRQKDFFQASGEAFAEAIDNRNLTVKILKIHDEDGNIADGLKGTNHVVVLDDNGEDVNQNMTAGGNSRLDEDMSRLLANPKLGHLELMNSNEKFRKDAFTSHTGMWEYGDPGSDNEQDDGMGKPPPRR